EIAASARELHTRLARFVTPFAKAGRQLGSAVAAYNEAVGSFDSRVMPQVRKIEQAGASSERELGPPEALEVTARSIASQGELEDRLQDELFEGAPAGAAARSATDRLRRLSSTTPSASATGTVAGSSLTAKKSRSNASAIPVVSTAAGSCERPSAASMPPSTAATNRSP